MCCAVVAGDGCQVGVALLVVVRARERTRPKQLAAVSTKQQACVQLPAHSPTLLLQNNPVIVLLLAALQGCLGLYTPSIYTIFTSCAQKRPQLWSFRLDLLAAFGYVACSQHQWQTQPLSHSVRFSTIFVILFAVCIHCYHMAAIFVPPSPQTSFAMSSHRPPLANVPNAANSPHHGGSNAAGVKRANSVSHLVTVFGQPPPKKRLLEKDDAVSRSPTKTRTTISGQTAESKIFSRRTHNTQATTFERKLMAAREKERQSQPRGSKYEKTSAETMDNIRQWQRHYRKAFPGFVFYFDSIPTDVRSRSLREVLALGAVSFDL